MPVVAAVAGAALATSFAAPAIIGAVGATSVLATGAITVAAGAIGGGLGSMAAGGEFGQGALVGATMGFGSAVSGALAGPATLPGQSSVGGGLFGGPGMTTGTPLYAQPGYAAGGASSLLPPAAGAAASTVAPAATAASTGYLATDGLAAAAAGSGTQGVLQSAISGLTDPETLARITLLASQDTPDVSGLTPAEQQLVAQRKVELQEIAATNQDLFEQQVLAAQNFFQMAEQQAPNPEQAFAETKIATERQLAEETRGASAEEAAFARRRAGIRGTQAGATAAAAEEARGRSSQVQLMQAGLQQIPTSAPEGYAGLALPLYEDLAERRRQAASETAYRNQRIADTLFGGIA